MHEPLDLWRAAWVALALWRVEHGEARWVPVHPQDPRPGAFGGRADLHARPPEAPAFLPIYVPPVPPLGIEAHNLRLWRHDARAFVRGLGYGERQLMGAYLGKGKPSTLVSYNPSAGRLQTHAPLDLLDLFVRLARRAEVDTPPPPGVE